MGRQASVWWIGVTAFIGAFSYAMLAAPYQQLIISQVCEQHLEESHRGNQTEDYGSTFKLGVTKINDPYLSNKHETNTEINN